MKAKLILTSKDRETVQDVPFDRQSITIGRKPTNDLAFNKREISGSHAAFLFENSEYFVMDLGSTNGTLLNGAQLVAREKYGLQDKDVVTVGPYAIQFVIEDESMETMIEVSAQPAQKKFRSGTAPDLASAQPPPRTGTEEQQIREKPARQSATVNKPPAAEKSEPPPPSPPAPAPEATPVANPAAAAPGFKNVLIPAPRKSPSAITDYLWFGIGALLVLAAIGLIIFILVGL